MYVVFNYLKFTLKRLKRYMFQSYDHPHGAYFVPSYSYSLKHSVTVARNKVCSLRMIV